MLEGTLMRVESPPSWTRCGNARAADYPEQTLTELTNQTTAAETTPSRSGETHCRRWLRSAVRGTRRNSD
jgi:hypothetical protein